jgi:hypothetical protein
VIVHTLVVADVNVTASPELALAVSAGDVPSACDPGFANVIVWVPLGVTLFEAADGDPVPADVVAVTVNV